MPFWKSQLFLLHLEKMPKFTDQAESFILEKNAFVKGQAVNQWYYSFPYFKKNTLWKDKQNKYIEETKSKRTDRLKTTKNEKIHPTVQ